MKFWKFWSENQRHEVMHIYSFISTNTKGLWAVSCSTLGQQETDLVPWASGTPPPSLHQHWSICPWHLVSLLSPTCHNTSHYSGTWEPPGRTFGRAIASSVEDVRAAIGKGEAVTARSRSVPGVCSHQLVGVPLHTVLIKTRRWSIQKQNPSPDKWSLKLVTVSC